MPNSSRARRSRYLSVFGCTAGRSADWATLPTASSQAVTEAAYAVC